MNRSDGLDALRGANPRLRAGFAQAVEAAAEIVRERIDADAQAVSRSRRRLVAVAIAVGLAVLAVVVAGVWLPGGTRGVGAAEAAVKYAAALTAASAERSGTATVRVTHNGQSWAGRTIRWNGADLAVSTVGRRGEFLLVDGMMYALDPSEGGWVVLGSPASIDPGSGTTPGEYLTAVREDIGGATLKRLAAGIAGLTSRRLADGSTLYSGSVAAALVARESGFKEGQTLRLLPFGLVAHGAAANPSAPLNVAVSVGSDGIVRGITVSWESWQYAVTYSELGSTPALAAPKDARPLRDHR